MISRVLSIQVQQEDEQENEVWNTRAPMVYFKTIICLAAYNSFWVMCLPSSKGFSTETTLFAFFFDLHAKGRAELPRSNVVSLCGKLTCCGGFVYKGCPFGIDHGSNPADLEVTKSHSKHQSAFIFVVGDPGVSGSDQNVHNGLKSWERERDTHSSCQNENFFGVL